MSHDIETIHIGQTEVEDDKIGRVSTNQVERSAPVGGGCDGIAPAFVDGPLGVRLDLLAQGAEVDAKIASKLASATVCAGQIDALSGRSTNRRLKFAGRKRLSVP